VDIEGAYGAYAPPVRNIYIYKWYQIFKFFRLYVKKIGALNQKERPDENSWLYDTA